MSLFNDIELISTCYGQTFDFVGMGVASNAAVLFTSPRVPSRGEGNKALHWRLGWSSVEKFVSYMKRSNHCMVIIAELKKASRLELYRKTLQVSNYSSTRLNGSSETTLVSHNVQ